MRWFVALFATSWVLVSSSLAPATPHEARVPLDHGRLRLNDLPSGIVARIPVQLGSVDLHSFEGSLMLRALDQSMNGSCGVNVPDDALLLHSDPDKLPRSIDDAKQSVRTFTSIAAPNAPADQRALMGLHLPRHVDPNRPLTI